jgi:hypothetical protein
MPPVQITWHDYRADNIAGSVCATPSNTASETQEYALDDGGADVHEDQGNPNIEESGSTDESNTTTIESFESTPEEDLDTTLRDIESEAQGSDSDESEAEEWEVEEEDEEAQAEASTQLDETEPEASLDEEANQEDPGNDEDTQQDEGVIQGTEDEVTATLPGSEDIPDEIIGTSIFSFYLRHPSMFSSFPFLQILGYKNPYKMCSAVNKCCLADTVVNCIARAIRWAPYRDFYLGSYLLALLFVPNLHTTMNDSAILIISWALICARRIHLMHATCFAANREMRSSPIIRG